MKRNADMKTTKSCLAIHDLSDLGKCSLTVALPILSAANIETTVLPTAVLSNHTAFKKFTCRDLTTDMRQSADIWREYKVAFDGMYSGFLGSKEQIAIVYDIFDMFRTEENLVMVDPVMGDNGKLYSTYTKEMADGMVSLCKKADIIVPNMTEATYILGKKYVSGPYEKEYVENILLELSKIGNKYVFLTGVYFDENKLGCACLNNKTGEITYSFAEKIPGMFHGTGDIFASVLFSAILNNRDIKFAMDLATEFTANSIKNTVQSGADPIFGVKFEPELGFLIEKVK